MTSQLAVAAPQPPSIPPTPVGPAGQLDTLAADLRRCATTLRQVLAGAEAAMRSPDLDDDGRHAALTTLRSMVWRVCRDVLPLVHRVPPGLRAHPHYRGCLQAAHELRELTQAARADHDHWRIDLTQEPALVGARR